MDWIHEPKENGIELPDNIRTDIEAGYKLERTAKREVEEILYARPDIAEALRTRTEGYEAIQRFYKLVAEYLAEVPLGTTIRAISQVGPDGGTLLNHYEGKLTSKGDKYFNMSDPKKNNGKPFTIGYSCLQYIEVVNHE